MTKRNGYQSKPRNTNQRQRKKIILLATEGKNKTETHYFRSLSGSSVIIRFAPGNYTDPVNMVHALKTEFEDQGLETAMGDVAYCLIDTDIDPTKDIQIENADIQAGNVATVIVSSPCFEIWYLCHYVKSTRQYSQVPGEEISYTQKEFRYAKDKGLPILAFIVSDDAELPKTFQDTNPDKIAKLKQFRSELETGRTVDYWKNYDHLATEVAVSLPKAFTSHPMPGWLRVKKDDYTREPDDKMNKCVEHYIAIKQVL